MKIRYLCTAVVIFLVCQQSTGQISPGDLAAPHSHLEGISNCTKCHDIGRKVSEEKCLACHLEIKDKIGKKKGYHSSTDVKSKNCISCHSDHHGVKFEIVHFDKTKFDHNLAGYPLTGKHLEAECVDCHTGKFISGGKIRDKKFTYLGLDTKCLGCHEDVHKNTLSTDCASCHSTSAFKPASLFDHLNTKFPLVGKHREVECVECHKVDQKEGKKFQEFALAKFNQCSSCHEDVHKKSFGPNCSSCHVEQSFEEIKYSAGFNHNVTDFSLKGKHWSIDCKACHKEGTKDLSTAFQEYSGKNVENCTTCHEDVHGNKFGQNCVQCHTEQSFQVARTPGEFNHDLTAFQLEGKHREVDCKSCHKNKLMDKLPHDKCMDCHSDYHRQQFVKAGVPTDCSACHVVQGFNESTYSIEQHQTASFPLRGAHLAVACLDCHKKDTTWNFKNLGVRCIDCHQDIHLGELNTKYYVQQECKNCHSEESWRAIEFNHDQTEFKLEGKHQQQKCNNCHRVANAVKGKNQIVFDLPSVACESCHQNVHLTQFEKNGSTDCARCHAFENWVASRFDHNRAAFQLDGAHKNVSCDKCHRTVEEKGVTYTQYKLIRFRCIDCHLF